MNPAAGVPINPPDHRSDYHCFRVNPMHERMLHNLYASNLVAETDNAKRIFLCRQLGVSYLEGLDVNDLEKQLCYAFLY